MDCQTGLAFDKNIKKIGVVKISINLNFSQVLNLGHKNAINNFLSVTIQLAAQIFD